MMDLDLNDFSGGPNWLSAEAKRPAVRAKHRAAWEAKHSRKRVPASAETMARLEQIIEQALREAQSMPAVIEAITPEAQLEVNAWNSHRERHRRGIGQPFAVRRKSRREQTPHNAAVRGFAVAINEAEKHRRVLKRRFGYTDPQIGNMARTYNSRKKNTTT